MLGTQTPDEQRKGAQHCDELVHEPHVPPPHACPLQSRQVEQVNPPSFPALPGPPPSLSKFPLPPSGLDMAGHAPQLPLVQQVPVAQFASIAHDGGVEGAGAGGVRHGAHAPLSQHNPAAQPAAPGAPASAAAASHVPV